MQHIFQKKYLVSLTLAVGLSLSVSSCGRGGKEDTGSNEPPPDPEKIPNTRPVPPPTILDCPEGTTLTYENFGRGFMLDHCTTCHSASLTDSDRRGAPEGVDLDSAEAVAIWNGGVMQQAAGKTQRMPPAGNVSAMERALLSEWLKCGAPSSR